MAAIENQALKRLKAGEVSIGIGLRQARLAETAIALAGCGYDWLFIDLEHNQMSIDTAAQLSAAALGFGIAPLVRVPQGQYTLATRALDGGAQGIVMPHVDSPEEAKEAVQKLRYPPVGHRSVTGALPQLRFAATPIGEATRAVDRETMLVLMLETPQAVEAADAIAAVEGVDALLIGTNDLAMEMGIPGDVGNPRIVTAYERVLAACKRHGKVPGMGGVYTEDLMRRYIGMGMRFVLAGNDLSFLMAAARQRAQFLRGL
jgi:4-hydroxy-2-oxoheptanedioate aldolase